MSITLTGRTLQKLPKSVTEIIAGTFSTTDTSGTFSTQLNIIKSATFSLFPTVVLAAAETLTIIGATIAADGSIIVPANKTLTIGRVGASVTSGLKFAVRLEGY